MRLQPKLWVVAVSREPTSHTSRADATARGEPPVQAWMVLCGPYQLSPAGSPVMFQLHYTTGRIRM